MKSYAFLLDLAALVVVSLLLATHGISEHAGVALLSALISARLTMNATRSQGDGGGVPPSSVVLLLLLSFGSLRPWRPAPSAAVTAAAVTVAALLLAGCSTPPFGAPFWGETRSWVEACLLVLGAAFGRPLRPAAGPCGGGPSFA